MNKEQLLNAAKDQAAREYGRTTYKSVQISVFDSNTEEETLNNLADLDLITDRAMEIYAEMEIKAIKEYADSFHGSGHEYWFILSKIDDLIRHKLNKFKPTNP